MSNSDVHSSLWAQCQLNYALYVAVKNNVSYWTYRLRTDANKCDKVWQLFVKQSYLADWVVFYMLYGNLFTALFLVVGNEYMKSESFASAVEEYTKAIEIDSSNAVYYCNRYRLKQ